jgi:hypothetical protein
LRPNTPANDGPIFFSPGLIEWQAAQWAKIFSPAAVSPYAYALSGMASTPANTSIIEQPAEASERGRNSFSMAASPTEFGLYTYLLETDFICIAVFWPGLAVYLQMSIGA